MTHPKRTNNKFLPDQSELSQILAQEVYFPIAHSKLTTHYPIFDTIIHFLDFLKLPTNLFTDDTLDINQVIEQGTLLLQGIIKTLPKYNSDQNLQKLFDQIYQYLCEEDPLEKSDLIFVFGSPTPLRAKKALEIYQKGLGKKIMLSGGNPIYRGENKHSEAEIYQEILLKSGVPQSKIIIENQSITIPDNVRSSLKKLQEQGRKFNSIILVNSPYSQRRGWAIFKKHLPDSIKIYRANSGTAITQENWFTKEENLRVVLNEFIKMRASVVYNTA